MFDVNVPLDRRPQLAYLISCFTCEQTTTFAVEGRSPLTQDQLHLELILKGWTIATRGYECPACGEHWVKGVVAFIKKGTREPARIVEGDAQKGVSEDASSPQGTSSSHS